MTKKNGKNSRKRASTAVWVEPAAFERDAASGVKVAVYGDDRGTKEALRHRAIERVDENVDGRVKTVTRTVSVVKAMLDKGEITADMFEQAQAYKDIFDRACMDALRASPMDGMPRSSGSYRQIDESNMVCVNRALIHALHHVLGGPESPMSKAMWHIVGMERGFGGRDGPKLERVALKSALKIALYMLVQRKNGHFKKRP